MSEVTLDHRSAGRIAATWFLDSGHTEFVFVTIGTRGHRRLWESFRSTLSKAGHSPDIFRLSASPKDGVKESPVNELVKMLRSKTPPLAILARCDHTAALVLEACERVGLPVPEEVSVIGCGNDKRVCRHTSPPLTSVEMDKETLGYVSAELLERMITTPTIQNRQVNMNARGVAARASTSDMAVRHQQAAKAFTYIEQNYQNSALKIDDIAAAADLSKPGLNNAFKKILGRTASEELRRRRLDHARNMLRNTTAKFYQIATESGFRSEKHMRDTFIRETGMRPTQIRHSEEEENLIDL